MLPGPSYGGQSGSLTEPPARPLGLSWGRDVCAKDPEAFGIGRHPGFLGPLPAAGRGQGAPTPAPGLDDIDGSEGANPCPPGEMVATPCENT